MTKHILPFCSIGACAHTLFIYATSNENHASTITDDAALSSNDDDFSSSALFCF